MNVGRGSSVGNKRTPQRRAKEWGREVENRALGQLKRFWPDMKRTGSVAYSKAAADLTTESGHVVVQCKGRQLTWVGKLMRSHKAANPDSKLWLVVTQDKHSKPLVTLDLEVFMSILTQGSYDAHKY